jgi:hypothetical protein
MIIAPPAFHVGAYGYTPRRRFMGRMIIAPTAFHVGAYGYTPLRRFMGRMIIAPTAFHVGAYGYTPLLLIQWRYLEVSCRGVWLYAPTIDPMALPGSIQHAR